MGVQGLQRRAQVGHQAAGHKRPRVTQMSPSSWVAFSGWERSNWAASSSTCRITSLCVCFTSSEFQELRGCYWKLRSYSAGTWPCPGTSNSITGPEPAACQVLGGRRRAVGDSPRSHLSRNRAETSESGEAASLRRNVIKRNEEKNEVMNPKTDRQVHRSRAKETERKRDCPKCEQT